MPGKVVCSTRLVASHGGLELQVLLYMSVYVDSAAISILSISFIAEPTNNCDTDCKPFAVEEKAIKKKRKRKN